MRLENNKLVLERRECWHCHGSRRVSGWVNCEVCKGTGKQRSNKRCSACANTFHNQDLRGKVCKSDMLDCTICTDDGTVSETRTDCVPEEIYQGLTFKVYRSSRHQTYGENLLAPRGSIYSLTDYGEYKNKTDEQIIAAVRSHGHVHACQIFDETNTLCDHVGIFCNSGGYSVIPVFSNPDAIEADLKAQLTPQQGMAIGMELYHRGLNGTLLAGEIRFFVKRKNS